jgi:hypothetical protein
MITRNHDTTLARAPETGQLVGVRLQPTDLAALDDWRRRQEDLPTRPEAIRRLIAQGLTPPPPMETKAAGGGAKRPLEQLYRAFLKADPRHLGQRGFKDGTTIDAAVAQEFDERGAIPGDTLGKLRRETRCLLQAFEYAAKTDRSGSAEKICARLRKLLK